MINVILCGGSGTRLWPISRKLLPKQFVRMFDNESLFQLTVKRNAKFCSGSYIVSNTEQLFLAKDQLCDLNKSDTGTFIVEPVGRNTAPAVALACMEAASDDVVFITPADHIIDCDDEYERVMLEAKKLAQDGGLVTFGITPDHPNTGFGYIQAGKNNSVESFHEKPTLDKAQEYLDSGKYFWNSGMFMFKAGVFLDELKKYSPEIYNATKIAFDNAKAIDGDVSLEDMANIPEDSIDYAVMEKSDKIKMVAANITWSDVGSFDSLYDHMSKDENGNALNDNHICIDSSNNLIYGGEKKIATVGVDDLIIVDTGDALLISKKGSSQRVKEVVSMLDDGLKNIHLKAYRPWGSYTVLEDKPGYKIKKIEVAPGKRLSLQKHFHRSEHWVVLSGTATVTNGDEITTVRPNESVYIRMGDIHRLENNGRIPIVLIEAQVGEYTGEDDIVRLEDDYNRA